jgi:phosphoenolpyruvate carboxykinase (ATP)
MSSFTLKQHEITVNRDPLFGLDVATGCPNVPSEILIPGNVWSDTAAYEATAKKLAGLFTTNFAANEEGVSAEVKAAGPMAQLLDCPFCPVNERLPL